MSDDLRKFIRKDRKYRAIAREHLKLAKVQLAIEDEPSLYYAALELRKALEALIYQIAGNYADDLPVKNLGTWQPAKLLQILLEIDPMADRTGEIRFARENDEPDHIPQWKSLGEDRRLTLGDIKQNYDALGAYLHTPTVMQRYKGKSHDPARLKKRLTAVCERLEEVLAGRVHNFTMRNTTSFDCTECGAKITRNLARLKGGLSDKNCDEMTIECFDCDASYIVHENEKGEIVRDDDLADIICPVESCGNLVHVWKRRATLGLRVRCSQCDSVLQIAMGILVENPDQAAP